MEEEVLDYLFKWAQSDGFKKSKDYFANLIKTNDEVFNYVYKFAEADGYKKGPEAFGKLLGRGISNKEEVIEKKPVENINVEEKSISSIPKKDSKVKSPPSIPVEMSGINTVTEKTEVKSVDTPSDKMVIKSEKKEEKPSKEMTETQSKVEAKEVTKDEPKMVIKSEKKGKEKNKVIAEPIKIEPIKIEPIKFETKEGPIQMEVPTFDIPEPKKKYKPYGEKGPDVYYSETQDQYIIKEGDSKTLVSKGSPKYDEIDKKIGETVKSTIEGTGKCDPDESVDSCSKNTLILSDFINNNYDNYESGWRGSSEGKLIHKLNEDKKSFDEEGESRYVRFSVMELEDQNEKDPEIQAINKRNYDANKGYGQIWYANDEPPKDKRFIIYKPYGDDRTLIYDKESEVILKQIGKAPDVDFSPTRTIYDKKGNVVKDGSNAREFYQNYKKNNPNEGLNVWYGYHKDRPEYKELKSIIEGIDYKKEKGTKNIFVPLSPGSDPTALPDWMKK